jgi:Ubiquinol-cytochrome C reductase hinge protein
MFFHSAIDSIDSFGILLTMFSSILLQSDEDGGVADKMSEIRAVCRKTCPKQLGKYNACKERITAKKEGDCEAWYIELLTCEDKCVAPKIFAATKGG